MAVSVSSPRSVCLTTVCIHICISSCTYEHYSVDTCSVVTDWLLPMVVVRADRAVHNVQERLYINSLFVLLHILIDLHWKTQSTVHYLHKWLG